MEKVNLTVPITINWKDIEGYMAQHDIMEVVRCRYCANNPKRSFLGCPMRNNPDRTEDDYCSYWERKTDATD